MSVNKSEERALRENGRQMEREVVSHQGFLLFSVKEKTPMISNCKSKVMDEWRVWSIREKGN